MSANYRTLDKQRFEHNKRRKRLQRLVGQAINDYAMIQDRDRIMVCLSGGKDSYTLLEILIALQKRAPVQFELVAVNLDQKQPGFPARILPEYLATLGIEYHIIEQDTYSIVQEKLEPGKTMCSLCSRMRRGILYNFAHEHGLNKIALGHHRDDIIETLFLNMFNGGKLKAMPPKLKSDDGRNIVIRPLAYCRESDIEAYAAEEEFPIIPCNLCGSQEGLQRQKIKQMLHNWEREYPGRVETIFKSMQHIEPSQLADRSLYNFAAF